MSKLRRAERIALLQRICAHAWAGNRCIKCDTQRTVLYTTPIRSKRTIRITGRRSA